MNSKKAHRRKKPGRITGIVLILLVLGFIVFLSIGLLDAFVFGGPGKQISGWYRVNGQDRGMFVAQPRTPAETGSMPAILLLHEWWGLDQEAVAKAQLIADAGFVVFVPDLYGGRMASSLAGALILSFSAKADQLDAAVDAAFEYAVSRPEVDPERLGVLGLCFGGTQAIRFGQRDPRPAALAIAYGLGLPDRDFGELGANSSLLGIFGSNDTLVPRTEITYFERGLRLMDRDIIITIYQGVGHAFIHTKDLQKSGPAAMAWSQILEFFSLHLVRKDGPPGILAML